MLAQTHVKASTLTKARHLGHEMARDPVIRPYLTNAVQYQSYHRFRIAHRAHWEQSTRFELYYQERIFTLADREAAHNGMSEYDSIANWDVWYHRVVHPIKSTFWETWETAMKLESRYLEALLNSGKACPSQFRSIVDGESDRPESAIPLPLLAQEPNVGPIPALLRFLHLGGRAV